MNIHYLNRYLKFIDALKYQSINGYSEKHHVLPKSMGGNDASSNIIYLTARQHFVAHWMLWKTYGGSMTTAFNYMNGITRYGQRINSRTAEMLKHEEIERQKQKTFSIETRLKMSNAKLGTKRPDELIEKIRQAQIGRKLSDEWRANVSKGKRGKSNGRLGCVVSEETKKRIGDAQRGELNHMAGRKHSPETRERMRIAHMKRNNNQAYLKWLDAGGVVLAADAAAEEGNTEGTQ
jgi:hypothetical protein